jgi:dolichol-phosphate mannosyltransferase
MKTIVVLPTFNERENIACIIRDILSEIEADIVVVDDNSPDNTAEVVIKLQESYAGVHLILRDSKRGLASAYTEGFRYALVNGYGVIIQMDSDYSHHPKYLSQLLSQVQDADVVVGSKYTKGGQVEGLIWWRKALSAWGNRYASIVLQMRRPAARLRDWTSGYLCWRADSLKRIDFDQIQCAGYGFLIELKWFAACLGMRMEEVPIVFSDRVRGRSKMSVGILRESLFLPFRLAFARLPGSVHKHDSLAVISKEAVDNDVRI